MLSLFNHLCQQCLYIFIPFVLQCLVQCKGMHGDPGNALQGRTIIMEVQIESLDLFRAITVKLMIRKKVSKGFLGKGENDFKIQWGTFAADDTEAIFANILPISIRPFR